VERGRWKEDSFVLCPFHPKPQVSNYQSPAEIKEIAEIWLRMEYYCLADGAEIAES
jgi:hypothetical protein